MRKPCPNGKVLNPASGRCVKECPPGKVLNPATGRCVKDLKNVKNVKNVKDVKEAKKEEKEEKNIKNKKVHEGHDVSGLENIDELYKNSAIKNWIKLIPMNKTVPISEYNRREYFKPVADIILDTSQKNTLIHFEPLVSKTEFNRKTEWLYLLTINDRIVKIGGTRTGLKGRVASYLCGHHIKERGKSGFCSKTNGFIYNTFEFYLNLGCSLKMYGYELPLTEFIVEIFGKEKKIKAQTYHAYESSFLEDFKKQYNEYPALSDNCDPDYKE